MKKRSLIASIAMLLVSAIVLSTSTYAWFSAGAAVSVEKITASVQNTDGSLQVSATGAADSWGDILEQSTIEALFASTQEGAADFIKPTNLIPITVNPGTATSTNGVYEGNFYTRTGTFSSELFDDNGDKNDDNVAAENKTPDVPVFKLITGANNTGNDGKSGQNPTNRYLTYKFYIKANADCSATLTPTFITGKNFLLGAVIVDGKAYIYSNDNTVTYVPVQASKTIRDIDRDGIITADDNIADLNVVSGALETNTVRTLGGTSDITLDFDSAGTVTGNGGQKTVTVIIWAEGQQAACAGACDASSASFSFAAVKAA
jgi:hypothetical protein